MKNCLYLTEKPRFLISAVLWLPWGTTCKSTHTSTVWGLKSYTHQFVWGRKSYQIKDQQDLRTARAFITVGFALICFMYSTKIYLELSLFGLWGGNMLTPSPFSSTETSEPMPKFTPEKGLTEAGTSILIFKCRDVFEISCEIEA